MKYDLTDYDGKVIRIDERQATTIANEAELIGVRVDGQIHYLNRKNIASIKPSQMTEPDIITEADRVLGRPDYRGRPSPAKEKLREQIKKGLLWQKTN